MATAAIGSLVTPGGAFFRGSNSYTLTNANFTVPPVGGTFVIEVADAKWVVPGQMVYVGGAGAGGAAAAFVVTAVNGNAVTLLNPQPPSGIGTVETGMVILDVGNSPPAGYLACDGANHLRADYPALAAKCGFKFGGDATHFKVPDLYPMAGVNFVIKI